MNGSLRLRKAECTDADAMAAVALRSKAHWGYSAEFMAACRDELLVTAAAIAGDGGAHFVAESDGALLGFYVLSPVAAGCCELEGLFVAPEVMGGGIGKALLAHAKTRAAMQGAETIRVQSDPHAEGFYLANGGERIGQQPSGSIPGRCLPVLRIAVTTDG